MAMDVRTEGSLRQNLRLLLTLFESKPHLIIIFHLKTNMQNLEKHHVNGSQTRSVTEKYCDSFLRYNGDVRL